MLFLIPKYQVCLEQKRPMPFYFNHSIYYTLSSLMEGVLASCCLMVYGYSLLIGLWFRNQMPFHPLLPSKQFTSRRLLSQNSNSAVCHSLLLLIILLIISRCYTCARTQMGLPNIRVVSGSACGWLPTGQDRN